jgi:hypothetical protein
MDIQIGATGPSAWPAVPGYSKPCIGGVAGSGRPAGAAAGLVGGLPGAAPAVVTALLATAGFAGPAGVPDTTAERAGGRVAGRLRVDPRRMEDPAA